MSDVDIEPFTDEDILIVEQLFKVKIDSMTKAKEDLLRYSSDNMVSFGIMTTISHDEFVFKDIVAIIKEHYMSKK